MSPDTASFAHMTSLRITYQNLLNKIVRLKHHTHLHSVLPAAILGVPPLTLDHGHHTGCALRPPHARLGQLSPARLTQWS